MMQSPAPWPDEWKREYVETIRRAVELHHDALRYDVRLAILQKGFADCWENFEKSKERSLFEVHRCQMRWYVEHLMGAELPSNEERQRLRGQFTHLWNHAASSLLVQFPFLDPNSVEPARADGLSLCFRRIDAPLMPAYLRPMSDEQVKQIKQRWHDLRYTRVDIWRQVGRRLPVPGRNGSVRPSTAERDHQLAKKTLSQLHGLIWMSAPQRPEYYLASLENRNKAVRLRSQVKRQAWSTKRRLEKTRSRQLPQIEHVSFLLATLLETAGCVDLAPPVESEEQHLCEE
jgi:hypothetical protein